MKKMLVPILFLLLIFSSCGTQQSESVSEDETTQPTHHIDHLIVAINNLDSGLAQFERLTGIKPIVGGEHPGRGTHNALVSLGEKTYLEIIAPRMGLDSAEYELSEYLLEYDQLTPIGWALNSVDAAKSKEYLVGMDFSASDLRPGARVKPDGTKLSWTTFQITEDVQGKPFFIQWGETSAHPATTSPKGVTLQSVSIESPDDVRLRALMEASGVEVSIQNGTFSMSLELTGPSGDVELSAAN